MILRWLEFDCSEGSDDTCTFDAIAAVMPAHALEVEAEIAQVLAWAEATFPGQRGPVDEGGIWDADVQRVEEPGAPPRICFCLSFGGTEMFCRAFAEVFLREGHS